MGHMSREELETFLTTNGSCTLACLEPDGAPYIVPVGYIYTNECFYIQGRARAAWAQYLQRDQRICLCVEGDERRVLVKGNAELIEGPVLLRESQTGVLWEEKAAREGWGEWWLKLADEPFWYFRVSPITITTAGDWAKRYKHYNW